jgi:DNA-binding transcriptional LysR family regulator
MLDQEIVMPPTALDFSGDRRITLEQFRAFVAVAESGSFQHAGSDMHRSQSAVTQSVQKLEDYLGCHLFERRQGLVLGLTPDGARLLPEALDILGRLDNAIRVLQKPELQGHISIGIPPSFRAVQLQNAMSSCMALNRGLRIDVICVMSDILEDMLEHGRLDVAILSQNRSDDIVDEKVMERVLKKDPLHWVANKKTDYRDVAELPLVSFTEGSPWREATEQSLERAGRSYYFSYISASYENACSAITAGFGLGTLPRSDVSEKHVVLGPEDGLPELPHIRVAMKVKTQNPVILQFCEMISKLPMFTRRGG